MDVMGDDKIIETLLDPDTQTPWPVYELKRLSSLGLGPFIIAREGK